MPALKNSLIYLLAFVLTSLEASLAYSGGLDGGGGNVVICREGKKIKSVELLDLFEARKIHGLVINKSQESYLKQAQRIAEKEGRSQHLFNASALEHTSRLIRLEKDLTFSTVNDSFHLAVPENCKVVQAAVYRERELFINEKIWNLLDETNRAALLLHETIYTQLRINHGEVNSLRTRRVVGALLAGVSLEDPWPEKNIHRLLPGGRHELAHVACASDSLPLPGTNAYAFILYPLPGLGDRFLIQFLRVNGQDVLTYTHGEFSSLEAKGDNLWLEKLGGEPEEFKGEDLENLFSVKAEGRSRILQRTSVLFQAKSSIDSQPIELTFERIRSRSGQEKSSFTATISEAGTPRKSKIQHCAYIPSKTSHCCSP